MSRDIPGPTAKIILGFLRGEHVQVRVGQNQSRTGPQWRISLGLTSSDWISRSSGVVLEEDHSRNDITGCTTEPSDRLKDLRGERISRSEVDVVFESIQRIDHRREGDHL